MATPVTGAGTGTGTSTGDATAAWQAAIQAATDKAMKFQALKAQLDGEKRIAEAQI